MGANRFLNLFLLEFNHAGQLASLLLQVAKFPFNHSLNLNGRYKLNGKWTKPKKLIQFDQTRLFYQPPGTSNYLIFYYLIYGANAALKNELHLNSGGGDELVAGSHLFNAGVGGGESLWSGEQQEDFGAALALVIDSLRVLAFDETEIKALFNILAALVHLGRAGASPVPNNNNNNGASQTSQQQRLGQFSSPNQAHIAASLLGISFNQLNDFVFTLNNVSNGLFLVHLY